MTWVCGVAFEKGCTYHGIGPSVGQISSCRWAVFKDIEPPKGCMISIKALRKRAVRV